MTKSLRQLPVVQDRRFRTDGDRKTTAIPITWSSDPSDNPGPQHSGTRRIAGVLCGRIAR
jgi:hypothetical protein